MKTVVSISKYFCERKIVIFHSCISIIQADLLHIVIDLNKKIIVGCVT